MTFYLLKIQKYSEKIVLNEKFTEIKQGFSEVFIRICSSSYVHPWKHLYQYVKPRNGEILKAYQYCTSMKEF